MEYEVSNIYDQVQPIFNELDPAVFDGITMESLSLLHRHWLEMKNLLISPKSGLNNPTQEELAEVGLSNVDDFSYFT